MVKDRKEILSSCCAFGGMTEEVHVLESDCPINREIGKREVQPINSDDKTRIECTCIYASAFGGGVPVCPHFMGVKEVQRNKRRKYKVLCAALKN